MSWDGNGNFTRSNGTHSGATTWANSRDAGNNITASLHDTHDEDLADGIAACLTKNNESKPTASFLPNATASYDLGATATRWRHGFFSGNADIGGQLILSGDLSPSQITGNQNNYNPTNLSTAGVLRLSTDATRDITGLQGGADGRTMPILNVGTKAIVLKAESASSDAANRFGMSSDLVLGPKQGITFVYDSTSSRWRLSMKPRLHVFVEDFGAVGDGSTDDAAAFQAANDYLATAGGDMFCLSKTYAIGTQVNLSRDVNIIGTHTPGSDPSDPPLGTKILRTADVIAFNLVGTNRTTDRVGRNRIAGIQFLDGTDLSSKDFFNCKYADSLTWENVTFWQPDSQTTAGHYIDVEECWDWRFINVIFKLYGNDAGTKHAINILNGADDNSNGWIFIACRWQEGLGYGVNFDSSGGGTNNHDFTFVACKMEDTGNEAKSHINGTVSDLKIIGGEYAGCGERQISLASGCTRTRISDATFANGGATATEMIELLGTKARVAGCTFQGPGASVTRYINTTGANAEVTGCNRADTTVPLVNAAGVSTDSKIHHNTDFLTEWGTTATLTSAGNTLVITHGMGYTPSLWDISVHFTGAPNNGIDALRISTITATQFSVTSYADGVATAPASDIGIAWKCQRIRG